MKLDEFIMKLRKAGYVYMGLAVGDYNVGKIEKWQPPFSDETSSILVEIKSLNEGFSVYGRLTQEKIDELL